MQKSQEDKPSELSYQGPLIGMRSTRPKSATPNGTKKTVIARPVAHRSALSRAEKRV